MTKYVTNQSQSNIGISGLNILLDIGGWAELTDEQAKHPEVSEAVRRGWVKIALVEPGTAEPFKPSIEMATPAVHGSKTIPKKAKKETA